MEREKPATGAGRRRMRRGPALALLALALLLGLYLLRVPILVGVARLVIAEDPLEPADAIFLLNGDARLATRALLAADLYHRGLAPRVVIARAEDPPAADMGFYPNDTDVNVRILRRQGVPDSAIVVLHRPGRGVASTTDEARVLRAYLSRRPATRVIVVTSAYHTARAGWLIRRALRGVPVDLRISGSREPAFDERNWWRTEEGLIRYFQEYVKFVHNWIFW